VTAGGRWTSQHRSPAQHLSGTPPPRWSGQSPLTAACDPFSGSGRGRNRKQDPSAPLRGASDKGRSGNHSS
jgi:hypothetical protein